MSNVLVINCGSTSTKYKFFNSLMIELENKNFSIKEKKYEKEFLNKILNFFEKNENNNKINKIAFRVVHGGNLKGPLELDEKVIKKIEYFLDFAPIHNGIVLNKIKKIKEIFKNKKIKFYAVFDTDFHQTIPDKNKFYAIDLDISKKYDIRKYGFHGIAVESALKNFWEDYKKKNIDKNIEKIPKKIIVAHLGGGSSLTAIVNETSIANTMGLTPISGLVMTTRVGEVDSDLDKILVKKMGKTLEEISHILSFESGLFGLTGTKDIKYIFDKAEEEKKEKTEKYKKEELAFDIYFEKLIEKIFAFVGKMNGVDKIIFSGGTGYGNSFLRREVAKRVKILGLGEKDFFITKVDEERVIFGKVLKME